MRLFALLVVTALYSHEWITDADLESLVSQPNLQKVDLSLSLITDAGMERLKSLENITDLNLFAVEHITDAGIASLRGWSKLQRLNLRGTDITDTSLEYLAQIPSIRSLDISYTQITNNGLEHLSALTNLEELALGGNKVTGAGLRVLKLLPALRSLNLNGAQKRNSGTWAVSLTDLDLDAVAGLKGLQSLDLGGLKITDAGIARLKPLAHLSALDVSRTEVSAGGLKSLSLNALHRLSLYKTKKIDDSVAEVLLSAGELEFIDLAETSFGDTGLARLAKLKGLKHLYLRGSGVTAAGVSAFRAARPSCEVSWE